MINEDALIKAGIDMIPILKEKFNLSDEGFSSHASDLYIRDPDGKIYNFLKQNYEFPYSVTFFHSNKDASWNGDRAVEVAFGSHAYWENIGRKYNLKENLCHNNQQNKK